MGWIDVHCSTESSHLNKDSLKEDPLLQRPQSKTTLPNTCASKVECWLKLEDSACMLIDKALGSMMSIR
jgi:hypothetical protein